MFARGLRRPLTPLTVGLSGCLFGLEILDAVQLVDLIIRKSYFIHIMTAK